MLDLIRDVLIVFDFKAEILVQKKINNNEIHKVYEQWILTDNTWSARSSNSCTHNSDL